MSESEKVKKSNKKSDSSIGWKLFSGVLFLTMVVGGMYGYSYLHTKLANIRKAKTEITVKVSELNTEIVKLTDYLELKTNELQQVKTQIAGIKDKDDLLKRDMEMYIRTTHPKVPKSVAKTIAINIVDKSRKYNTSPELVLGICKVESSFNPMVVGPKTKYGHARGLMQVMPEWAPKLGLKSKWQFHNIDTAIESGIRVFLIHLEEGKGDISTGLYYYVNKDKTYVSNVYAAMGKFVAYRATMDDDKSNVETDIDLNGDSKEIPEDEKKEAKK